MENKKSDIAIVGMACRFPGASSLEEFWQILHEGRDVVGQINDDRWSTDYYYHPNPKQPGKSYTWSAGLLTDIDRFDAQFFGISPREAAQMDPQQRLLLELAWQALEDGGQLPDRLARSDCSVFVGMSSTDYMYRRLGDPSSGDAYFMTGSAASIAANRLSYWFDLHGPSMAIDTACSSSLIALHQACQSLRSGESSMALAGGVNLLLSPFPYIGFSKASMLSKSGRCRAFDASADGYVRAEGGAVVFLKPLQRAEADGDPIHAVILASAVNADGRTYGISLPNAAAQQRLLRLAYQQAGVDVRRIAYLEAHGTGTAAGDPQEAGAIGTAIGIARARTNPLLIGSVKTNLGHLEPVSGLAGLVKVVLALEHRTIPASLHFTTPHPRIPFENLNLKVVTENTPLPEHVEPAVMGVSSFGFGGANAHVVLREYRRPNTRTTLPAGPLPPLFLSAHSENALKEMASTYRDLLRQRARPEAYDIFYTTATRRQGHAVRLAVFGPDAQEVADRLDAFCKDVASPGVVSGSAVARRTRLALVFSGNGCQWQGMGRRLLEVDTVFEARVRQVDALLRPLAGFSVLDELQTTPERSRLHLTEVAQPVLFALQVGLLETLLAKGLSPEAVVGHSVGEVAAAYAAGALTLEQASRVVFERSRAQALTRGLGRMAAVGLSLADAEAELAAHGSSVEVAAVNSPTSVTLSGPLEELLALKARFDSRGTFFHLLDLEYPFHSRAMDSAKASLLQGLEDLAPRGTRIPFVSSTTGSVLQGEELGAAYWWANIREPVRFDAAVTALAAIHFRVFLEIGPHPILQGYVRETLKGCNLPGRAVPTLERAGDDEIRVLEALSTTYVLGCPIEFDQLFPTRGNYVSLPAYPWQRESYWYPTTSEAVERVTRHRDHPLLGYQLGYGEGVWENEIDAERFSWLRDHVVAGATVVPASAFIEMALAASMVRFGGPSHEVEGLEIRSPLVLADGESRSVRFCLSPEDGSFTIRSRIRLNDEPWTVNVVGRLTGGSSRPVPAPVDLGSAKRGHLRRIDAEQHYSNVAKRQLHYGPSFRGLSEVWVGRAWAMARILAPASVAAELDAYHLHPCLSDAGCQALFDILDENECWGTFVPSRIDRAVYYGAIGDVCHCRAHVDRTHDHSVVARFQMLDGLGNVRAELAGVRSQRIHPPEVDRVAGTSYEYRVVARPGKRVAAHATLPLPTALTEHVVPTLERLSLARRRDEFYARARPLFDTLVAAFAYRALQELGAGHASFTPQGLVDSGKVAAQHTALLSWMLGILEEEAAIRRTGSEWALADPGPLPDAEEIWRSLLAEFPSYLPEVGLAGRCGRHLAEILRGDVDEQEVLGSGSGLSASAQLDEGSPTSGILKAAAREALAEILRNWSAERRLRILAIGNGAADLAADLRSEPSAERCDCAVAADPASKIHPAWSDRSGLDVVKLDINRDLAPQDIETHGYDVVVTTNLVDSSRDVERALRNIGSLLVGGGLLVAVVRSPERLIDFIFGIQPEWWGNATEAGRSRLLSSEAWKRVLHGAGFTHAILVAEPAGSATASGHVLLARNPEPSQAFTDIAPPEPRAYLLLTDEQGDSWSLADQLSQLLHRDGHEVVTVTGGSGFERRGDSQFVAAPQNLDDFHRLCTILEQENRVCDEVVHLMGFSLQPDSSDTDLMDVQDRRCVSIVHLIQGIAAAGWSSAPRLWLITAGAAVATADSAASHRWRPIPSQSPLWGVGRVVMNEHPALRCKLIDLHPQTDGSSLAQVLARELREPDDEDEVVLAGDARYVMRIQDAPLAGSQNEAVAPANDAAVRLEVAAPRSPRNLRWRHEPRRKPGRGELEIHVRATGLNYRDVMYTTGMLSDESLENGFAGSTLGLECAGTVESVGSDVAAFRVGDPVMGFSPACFASHVITPAWAVTRRPVGWTDEDAATVPVAFFTAYYALHHVARLEPGERVLVHGGAGGVGLAAIQYARFRGAELFATAGSDEKRDFLRGVGAAHVFDSRTLAFADQVLEITGGSGVDVVLNSLSGEAVRRSLAVLRPFGRFLELGKRDYYENTKIGLRPFRNNISYFGIDVDQLLLERQELAVRLFGEIMELFKQGAFRPLPHRVFPNSQVADAFRHMQASRHIGKIVVAGGDRTPAADEPALRRGPLSLSPEHTYLITGGLSGLGLATARWMVEKGARHLALMGRRGASTPEARAAVAEIEASGAVVHVLAVDVADAELLACAFRDLDRLAPSLRGVVHAAMVLEDALIRHLNVHQLRRVLRPKMLGASNLDRLTRHMNLDFFVLYSSATTYLGSPGQASYVAANAYLECLAQDRKRQGLPGLAVSWGPISDVGYLAREQSDRSRLLSKLGGRALNSHQVLGTLEELLITDRASVAVMNLDWGVVRQSLPTVRSPKFSRLAGDGGDGAPQSDMDEGVRESLAKLAQLELLSKAELELVVANLLSWEVAKVLHMPASKVDTKRSVYDLGLDSLMAVELETAIHERFGVNMSIIEVIEGVTIDQMAVRIAKRLPGAGGGSGADLKVLASGAAGSDKLPVA